MFFFFRLGQEKKVKSEKSMIVRRIGAGGGGGGGRGGKRGKEGKGEKTKDS